MSYRFSKHAKTWDRQELKWASLRACVCHETEVGQLYEGGTVTNQSGPVVRAWDCHELKWISCTSAGLSRTEVDQLYESGIVTN